VAAGRPLQCLLAAAAVLVTGVLLAGCGSGPAANGEEVTGVGQEVAGSVAPLAQCRDWVEGSRAQRLATIHDIREQLNQTGGGEPTSDLGDEQAYAVLQRACRQDFAVGFRLYKLYARAAAFQPLLSEK
jgi:hypothetical protein